MKEGQTQEPVKIFIADFKNKILWDPEIWEKWEDFNQAEREYNRREEYPATWLTIEMDGKEFIEGKDFFVNIMGDAFHLPQEPVGGMDELTDKFIQTMTGNCEHEAYCQREECKWKGMTVCLSVQEEAKQCAKIAFEYFTSPPAPIGIDVEELISAFIVDALHEKYPSSKKITAGILYILSKAGYAASLNNKNDKND